MAVGAFAGSGIYSAFFRSSRPPGPSWASSSAIGASCVSPGVERGTGARRSSTVTGGRGKVPARRVPRATGAAWPTVIP